VLAALAVSVTLPMATAATARPSSWVVYWSESPWPSIWATRPDGSHDHRILRNRQNGKRPRLSPDRAWVAFDGAPAGKPVMSDFDIQVVRLDGSDLHTLTSTPDWDTDAQWSPNGDWFGFTRSPPSPIDCSDSAIWIMRRDGSDPRRVVAGCGARWSPDGARLVYTSPVGGDLFVVDVSGGAPRRLLATRAYEYPAGWSPDGKKILFTRSYDPIGRIADVLVMNADGTHVRKLADGFAGCWSPNGSRILYTQSFFSALFVMNADGSHKHRISRALAAEPDWR
jgi:TolB protein